jgi:hypothetical protein
MKFQIEEFIKIYRETLISLTTQVNELIFNTETYRHFCAYQSKTCFEKKL